MGVGSVKRSSDLQDYAQSFFGTWFVLINPDIQSRAIHVLKDEECTSLTIFERQKGGDVRMAYLSLCTCLPEKQVPC